MKKNLKQRKAATLSIMFIVSMLILPISGAIQTPDTKGAINRRIENLIEPKESYFPRNERDPYIKRPTVNDIIPSSSIDIENDMGYNIDAGNQIAGSRNIYPGEPNDECPGRTGQGYLSPTNGDSEDWYRFYVCEGQIIEPQLQTTQNYEIELLNSLGESVEIPYTAETTGSCFISVVANEASDDGHYELQIILPNQNDVGSGRDAGDNINGATTIQQGSYTGYLDYQDEEDWYQFEVNTGQGITITVIPLDETDYDIHLYNPNDEKVKSAQYYGEDTLTYQADSSGTWSCKLDIFPGYDETRWPDDYFVYGSGPYELTLELGGSFPPSPQPNSQPEIHPLAQTIIINDDPSSNTDEYSYLAAVPASNYLNNNQRFVSPIVYQGKNTPTHWFGTIDNTTQYLLDDWTTYLQRHGVNAEELILPSNPIEGAASIATSRWDTSDTVILAVDGSSYLDSIETIIDEQTTLNPTTNVQSIQPSELRDIGGLYSKPMFISDNWGAIAVHAMGESFSGDAGIITPKYESLMADFWPHPSDEDGSDTDVYFPVTKSGFWLPYTDDVGSLDRMIVTTVKGDHYNIPIQSTDCSINVTVTTEQPSYLRVYLIDPEGNVRRPSVPHWNGGHINPIHIWNGGHWDEIGAEQWRFWEPELSTTHSVELHHPMQGIWTAIVVPPSLDTIDGSVSYSIKGDIRSHNPQRINAGLSAANAAVLASLNHAPLLFVTEDAVPGETQDALDSLGANTIIFVNIGEISSANPTATSVFTSLSEVVNAIKQYETSENYITITSFATSDGYFAPAAMIAAYHGSPVLNMGEAATAYDTIDIISSFEEYAGDFYHGCRSLGHMACMDHPFDMQELIRGILNGEFPHPGFDMKLRLYTQTYEDMAALIDNYQLDNPGKEVLMFVSPRETDIRSHISRAVEGNKSYAGQIPVETTAFATALICRNILYPALIYSNPGRDYTSAVMMNHWEEYDWITNDGITHTNQFTKRVKELFSSNDRRFDAHIIWDNILQRYNDGCSVMYHSSHGTGGSGICCMYKNFAEQFPFAELTYEHLKDFDWWDAWRGYYYDNRVTETARENGRFWCNSVEPTLYDIVHFKWCDQLFDNLHSQMTLWQSCTTAHHFGPMIYLEHGSVLWYGNANTGRSPQTDFMDSWWFEDFFINGKSIGESHSELLWLFGRDYTTQDPTTIYGVSSMDSNAQVGGDGEGLVNTWVFFGDPELQLYRPDWTEPEPQSP